MSTKRHYLLLGFIICFLVLLFIFKIPIHCVFKEILNINCGSCGLTRGVYELLNFNFIAATKYNLFIIPLSFLFIIYLGISFIDILLKKHYVNYFYKGIYKARYIILICYGISLIYNNFI